MERKVLIGVFIFCGAVLGWASSLLINRGATTGWLLFVAAICCLFVAWGESRTKYD